MKPITGSGVVALGSLRVLPPSPPHTYFGVAESLMPGIGLLASATPPPAIALSLLAAHALECLLKAYLSRFGSDAALKKSNIRHDLEKLWSMAVGDGLAVPDPPPSWVTNLGRVHKEPYHLRYSTGIHGIVLPAPEPMASELANLLEIVRTQI